MNLVRRYAARSSLARLRRHVPLGMLLALTANGLAVPSADAAVPGLGPVATIAQIDGTAPNTYYPYIYGSAGLLRADGSIAWPSPPNGDWTEIKADGIALTSLNYLGSNPTWSSIDVGDDANVGVGVHLPTLAAVKGLDWMVSAPERDASSTDSPIIPATPTLVAIDGANRVVRRLPLPNGAYSAGAITLHPWRHGLRVLIAGRDEVSVVDETGRTLKRLPSLDEFQQSATSADGSLYVTGIGPGDGLVNSGTFASIVRLDARGKLHTIDGARKTETVRGWTGMVPAFGGIVVSEGLQSDTRTSVAVIRGDRTVRRVRASRLAFPASAECRDAPGHWISIDGIVLGASGNPIVEASCNTEGDRLPNVLQHAVLGLDHKLRVRWRETAAPLYPSLIGPDGRLLETGSAVFAAREPGSLAVGRGFVRGQVRRSGREATVSIVCRRPFGGVCNGTVEILLGKRVVGSAIYAAPARPGAMAATIRRTVPISAASAQLSARLRPIRGY